MALAPVAPTLVAGLSLAARATSSAIVAARPPPPARADCSPVRLGPPRPSFGWVADECWAARATSGAIVAARPPLAALPVESPTEVAEECRAASATSSAMVAARPPAPARGSSRPPGADSPTDVAVEWRAASATSSAMVAARPPPPARGVVSTWAGVTSPRVADADDWTVSEPVEVLPPAGAISCEDESRSTLGPLSTAATSCESEVGPVAAVAPPRPIMCLSSSTMWTASALMSWSVGSSVVASEVPDVASLEWGMIEAGLGRPATVPLAGVLVGPTSRSPAVLLAEVWPAGKGEWMAGMASAGRVTLADRTATRGLERTARLTVGALSELGNLVGRDPGILLEAGRAVLDGVADVLSRRRRRVSRAGSRRLLVRDRVGRRPDRRRASGRARVKLADQRGGDGVWSPGRDGRQSVGQDRAAVESRGQTVGGLADSVESGRDVLVDGRRCVRAAR